MKRLYLIGGTMGVGKTTACQQLKRLLDRCVFLDGDWCWDMHPFQLTEDTRAMVLENICFLLNQFLRCPAYENVVFCWVLHEQAIWDRILSALALDGVQVCRVALVCGEQALAARLERDIAEGRREPDVLARSIARLTLYDRLAVPRLVVSALTPRETAERILRLAAEAAQG